LASGAICDAYGWHAFRGSNNAESARIYSQVGDRNSEIGGEVMDSEFDVRMALVMFVSMLTIAIYSTFFS
jgi:hypothetical protein